MTDASRVHSGNRVGIPRARARFLTQARQLEESTAPGVVSGCIWLTALLIAGAIVWAALTELSEVARAPGEVVPSGLVQKIQHLEGGLVQDIHVRNGDTVAQGDPLLSLDPDTVRSELEQLEARGVSLTLASTRLRALLDDHAPDFERYETTYPALVRSQSALYADQHASRRDQLALAAMQTAQRDTELTALNGQIEAARKEIELLRELESMEAVLADQAIVARIDLINVAVRLADASRRLSELVGRQAIAKRALAEARQSQHELDSRLREQLSIEANELEAELAEVEQSKLRARQRLERLALRAPVDGIVKGLSANTIAEVIEPGQVIMEIVPTTEALIVESRITTTDIGHVRPGQAVDVKVTSFESTRFGTVSGILRRLSASTYLDADNQPYYRAEIELEKDYMGADPAYNRIIPGMTVQADIVTGHKSVLDYILKPVYRGFQGSFRER